MSSATASPGAAPRETGRPRAGILDRLTVRARLFALSAALVALGGVCVLIATTGLSGQKNKVHASNVIFTNSRMERDAYEGWLTADDQMNMFAALEVLQDPSQRQLASVTWGQVVSGHAQTTKALTWLAANAVDGAIRARARTTLADLNAYSTFTMRMHAAAGAGRFRRAVHRNPKGGIGYVGDRAGMSGAVDRCAHGWSIRYRLRATVARASATSVTRQSP